MPYFWCTPPKLTLCSAAQRRPVHRTCNTDYLLRSTERIRKQKFELRLDISSETRYCSHLLSPLSNLKSTRTVFIRIEAPSRIKAPPLFLEGNKFFFSNLIFINCYILSNVINILCESF